MTKNATKFASLAVLGALTLGAGALIGRGIPSTAEAQGGAAENAGVIKVGQKVEPFTLPNVAGGNATVGDFAKSKATVLMFIATKCPISNAYNERMAKIASAYTPRGVAFYGINPNKTEPAAEVAAHAKQHGFGFTVLKDPGNKIADRFDAQVTPEIYVIDSSGKLVYKGQLDNRQNESAVTERPLAAALDALLAGKAVPTAVTRAFGCSIKR